MSTTIRAITRTDLNSNVLGGAAWIPINPLGIPEVCFKLKIINASNVDVDISLDGLVTNDWCIHGVGIDIDGQAYHEGLDEQGLWAKGQIIYVKAAGAGVGTIMLVGYYV